jgi:hypothetical protein
VVIGEAFWRPHLGSPWSACSLVASVCCGAHEMASLLRTTTFWGATKAWEGRTECSPRPFAGTLRVSNPVRSRLAASRKRVLRGGGRPPTRSVDSERVGRAIEPRNQ